MCVAVYKHVIHVRHGADVVDSVFWILQTLCTKVYLYLKVFAVVIVTNISTCEYNENCVCSIPANDSYNFDNESSKLVIVR